jgi:hypothetical protein
MKDKIKILLGEKDVFPQVNKDVYINLEIYSSPNEIKKELVNNDFNVREQFNKERRESLRFCIYGTLNSIFSDANNLSIELKTNHEDLLFSPRIEPNAKSSVTHKVLSAPLSKNNNLSKNIFKKNKSCFNFLFEISPDINNYGETKVLEVKIIDEDKSIFANFEIPFLFFDSEGNLIDYGTETVDIDIEGNEQVVENDFPFFYGTHWIKQEFNLSKPPKISLVKSESDNLNNLTVNERTGEVKFYAKLEVPSVYGAEEAEVYIERDETLKDPNEDFVFENQILKWEKGEQFKEVNLQVLDDLFTEEDERIVFGIKNLKYSEKDINSNFELIIKNDDLPSPIGFESKQFEITSGDKLNISLEADTPIKGVNQTIDLVLDDVNSTITIGEDIENTGTIEEPEFRKTILLKEGLDLFEIEIDIKESFNYGLDKEAIFKLENPTQNIKIKDNLKQFNLTVKDKLVKRYTTYKIDSDPLRGQGIFRLSYRSPKSVGIPISFANTNLYSKYHVTNNFTYKINIINEGEIVSYDNKLINPGEVVTSISSSDGFQNFEFTLPSNYSFDKQNVFYEKSKYKFVITDIESSSKIQVIKKDYITFADVNIDSQALDSSLDFSGKTYYLTSEILNIKTRLDLNSDLKSEKKIYDIIKKAKIKLSDNFTVIKQKLRDAGYYKKNTFILLNNNKFDEKKITSTANSILNFISKYPTFEIPNFFTPSNEISSFSIECKINGLLILSKLFSKTSAVTKVNNIKFEENPIEYTYFKEVDGSNYTLMPVEPLNNY